MKSYTILLLLFLLIISCKESAKSESIQEPTVSVKDLQSDFMKWWTYYNTDIQLSSNFLALDEHNKAISKDQFLRALKTGKYMPILLKSKDVNSVKQYKLFQIMPNVAKNIRGTIQMMAEIAYKHFLLEGTPFPNFSFKNLQGKSVTNSNTQGKILIVKCWYIHCQKCIEEFPILNKLVTNYANRKDLLFISLASDTEKQLQEFLLKKPFNYQVIANQHAFMHQTLKVLTFPTHFIVDKNGIIIKVVNSAEELEHELQVLLNNKETSTTSSYVN